MIDKYIKANKTAIKLLKSIREIAEVAGITEKQLITLHSINSGNTDFKMICKHTGILGPSLTRIVENLCANGLASKDHGGKMIIIDSTIKGRKVLEELEK